MPEPDPDVEAAVAAAKTAVERVADRTAQQPAPAPPAPGGALNLDVSADAVKDASIEVVRDQMLQGLDREAQARASLNTLAQRYVSEKAQWDEERERLLAQIARLQDGQHGSRKTRQREQLPPVEPRPTPTADGQKPAVKKASPRKATGRR
jgi:hypothetical protein